MIIAQRSNSLSCFDKKHSSSSSSRIIRCSSEGGSSSSMLKIDMSFSLLDQT